MNAKTLVLSSLAAVGLTALSLGPAEAPGLMEGTAPNRESRAYLHSFNLPAHGVAIQGFSPVSYFEGRAERGSALFAVEHRGVTYHLTDAGQVETFKQNPARYEPAFGGWCAFGMAVKDKFPIDPHRFRIVHGRLFLFLQNPGVDALELWKKKDESELLKKAEAHWTRVRG